MSIKKKEQIEWRMIMEKDNNNGTGVSILSLYQMAFIILKITNLIDWSWWLVLIPAWVQLLLGIIGSLLFTKEK